MLQMSQKAPVRPWLAPSFGCVRSQARSRQENYRRLLDVIALILQGGSTERRGDLTSMECWRERVEATSGSQRSNLFCTAKIARESPRLNRVRNRSTDCVDTGEAGRSAFEFAARRGSPTSRRVR